MKTLASPWKIHFPLLTLATAILLAFTAEHASAQSSNQPPSVAIVSPTNGAVFIAPADIPITADVTLGDHWVNLISIFEGTNRLITLILDPLPHFTNGMVVPIQYTWSGVPPGNYSLTVVAGDTAGSSATSAPVNISVIIPTNPIPTVTIVATDPVASVFGDTGTFTVYRTGFGSNNINVFYTIGGTASNGVDYATLPNIVTIPAGAASTVITVKPLPDPLPDPDETVILHLTQPPGLSPTSYLVGVPNTAAVTITGNVSNSPPTVSIVSPTNGAVFVAPVDIFLLANASDADGPQTVETVEFFDGTNSLGIATNFPVASPIGPFHLIWSNAPPGIHVLTAVATDDHGATGTSAPVNITIFSPSNTPPVVSIFATDPIAVEGTNFHCVPPTAVFTNFCTGTNTATFLVHRAGDMSADLTVYYGIGGTSSNGVDYALIPDNVTIPAGKSFALVTIVPLEDVDPTPRLFDTVVLSLTLPPPGPVTTPPPYLIGFPRRAAAIILEDFDLPCPRASVSPDGCFHASLPGANGSVICLQSSTDLVNWTPVCTNMVLKGSADFVDPDAATVAARYYRTVPATGAPSY